MKIEDYLKGKFVYDNYNQFIWLVQPNGHNQKIADLRGWGAIQNLFKQKSGKIDMDKAAKFQDQIGQWVSDSLNKQLESIEDTLTTDDLKDLDQARDDYYNRDKLFERKQVKGK